jgi:hypothetical protein
MTKRTWENSYSNMMARCYRVANKDYHSYGGRGIIVCDEWKNNPKQFYADMGDKPEGMTLDRIDPNKGYSPDNCRWASWRQQGRNRTNNSIVEFNGVKMCVAEAADLAGIKQETIRGRLRRNATDLFVTPLPRGKNRDKTATVITPSGEHIVASNIKQFCLQRNLDYSSMTKVLRGDRAEHKGFTGRYLEAA